MAQTLYTISVDTANGVVVGKLEDEIRVLALTSAEYQGFITHVDADQLIIKSDVPFSAADKIKLTAAIAAHDGVQVDPDPGDDEEFEVEDKVIRREASVDEARQRLRDGVTDVRIKRAEARAASDVGVVSDRVRALGRTSSSVESKVEAVSSDTKAALAGLEAKIIKAERSSLSATLAAGEAVDARVLGLSDRVRALEKKPPAAVDTPTNTGSLSANARDTARLIDAKISSNDQEQANKLGLVAGGLSSKISAAVRTVDASLKAHVGQYGDIVSGLGHRILNVEKATRATASNVGRVEQDLRGALSGLVARFEKSIQVVEGRLGDHIGQYVQSLQALKYKLRNAERRFTTLGTKVSHVESGILDLSADTARAKLARGSLFRTDKWHQEQIDSIHLAVSGRAVLNVDQDIGSHGVDIAAGTLNGAAAGTHLEPVSVYLSSRTIVDGVTDVFTALPFSFHPKITVSESVADADVGVPGYYAGLRVPVTLGGTATWPGGSGATATLLIDDTGGVGIGDAVRGNTGDWFEVIGLVADTSLLLANPHGFTLPSSGTTADVGDLPRFVAGGLALVIVPDTDAGATKTYVAAESVDLTVDVSAVAILQGVPDMVVTLDVTA